MTVSYNRLWKLLIDKGTTKMKMQKKRVSIGQYSPKREKMVTVQTS